MNILCVGKASYDTVFNIDHFIKENETIEASSTNEIGGIICNISYLLGKWNKNTYFIGEVGNDEKGLIIKKELEKQNVNTSYMQISDIKTISNTIINNLKNGSKTILSSNLNNKYMETLKIDVKKNIIIMDGSEYDVSLSLIKDKDVISIMIADIYNDKIYDLAKKTNFVICSSSFASKVINKEINKNNLEEVYLNLKQIFNNILVVLKDGYLYEDNDEIKIVPSIKNNKINDIFCSSFIYAIDNNYNYEDAIIFASIANQISNELNMKTIDIKLIEEKYNEYR